MHMCVLRQAVALQIHWPVTEPQKKGDRIDPSVKETWTAMEKLVDEVSQMMSSDIQLRFSWLLQLSPYRRILRVKAHAPLSICCLPSRGLSVSGTRDHLGFSTLAGPGETPWHDHLLIILCLQGLVRNIGISNFSIRKTQEVLAFCRIRPAVNQVRSAPPCASSVPSYARRCCVIH